MASINPLSDYPYRFPWLAGFFTVLIWLLLLGSCSRPAEPVFQKEFTLSVSTEGQGSVNQRVLNEMDLATASPRRVELTATPVDGWEFTSWSGDLQGSQNPAVIALDGDKQLVAVFMNRPVLTTSEVTNIRSTSAVSGGVIQNEGSSPVTARGVVWNTAGEPTTEQNEGITTDGSGTGSFTSSLANLNPDTQYYVRAYATNSAGTSYGASLSFTTRDGNVAVTTFEITEITTESALGGGEITDDGGDPVTVRGVCWSTSQNPTTSNSCTSDGSGTGSFTSNLTSLNPDTRYFVRAYATNSQGTAYGNQREFRTQVQTSLPTVSTASVTSITENSAQSGGNVTDDGNASVTARGVCWSTSQNPTTSNSCTTNGSGTGSFTSNLTGLNPDTRYYVRAYATNSAGTAYGNQREFRTQVQVSLPTVSTSAVSSITETSAQSGGNVSDDGGASVTARGVCWSTSQNPTTGDTCTSNGSGTGSFTSNLTGLNPDTQYYVRAYATNSQGTAYGNQRDFTTDREVGLATVSTSAVSSITETSAQSGGNVSDDGGASVTARGVCWSTSQNPTTGDTCTSNGSGTGSFTSNLTNLNPDTRYYVRAYATNSAGTAYGNQREFRTQVQVSLPTVSTSSVSSITENSAQSGGNVSDDGGASVTARGVCWSTSQNPTTGDTCTSNGSGTGSFTSNLTNLNPDTRYYVRAYATNSAGTAYGNQRNFTTASGSDDSGRDNSTAVVDVNNPATGRTWMDRNLGASRAATSSMDSQAYGDLYQWGRSADDHQQRSSPTTGTLSSNDRPGHGSFILSPNNPWDWRSPKNDNLWQGVNGANNPCPAGYRLPTEAEWIAERDSWSSNSTDGAFSSSLKLPMAGTRNYSNGSLFAVDSGGRYWSGTVDGSYARSLYFDSDDADIHTIRRAVGRSVRCIKN